MTFRTRSYYLALQQRDEHLWSGIPSPGEYVPLRLMAKGQGPATVIERVWTPLGGGELVYCKEPSWAGHWGTETRVRFPAPLQTLTQQTGQILQVCARVVGPLSGLLLLCVDRWAADQAVNELDDVRDVLACAPRA